MSYRSTNDPLFRDCVARWIAARHEVLALIRYVYGAGTRSYEFFDSWEPFAARLQALQPKDSVTVFGRQQLPVRGQVDEEFISKALSLLPDGTEWAVTGLEKVTYGKCSWYEDHSGETHQELRETLRDMLGQRVALGPYPPFWEDNSDVITAYVPDPNGVVVPGSY